FDEVESLPCAAQAKLLRFLQEGEYRPLGGATSRQADTRVIAASNANLEQLSLLGTFRQDLLFRLNVLPVRLPPLRERLEDVPLLTAQLVQRHATALGVGPVDFSSEAIEKMISYEWPGNIRELENVIQRALVGRTGEIISAGDIELQNGRLCSVGGTFKQQK